jgi:gamma-glutamylcyclotransferase (GGCT)/AIG2-like uncharacterized protein YtfP
VPPGQSVFSLAAERRREEISLPVLRLFVYGSLKRGFNNHELYCRGVRSVETACTQGNLYRLPTGYPVLALPASRFLAWGSRDALADLAAQQRLDDGAVPTGTSITNSLVPGRSRVWGEILTFANPVDRLRAIDALEGFRPGHKSRYARVLIRVYSRLDRLEVLAWTYVAGPLAAGRRLIPTGRW